jgi:hypothetical integral membrane protein (TIGR02206 family)
MPGMAARFVLFGPDHLAALAATAAVGWLLSWLVGRDPRGKAACSVRLGLAVLLLAAMAAYLAYLSTTRPLGVWDFVPLHLCDFLVFMAAFALVTQHPLACELLYFWASTGTLLAMVTPDLAFGFPHPYFFTFFVLHGGVVVAAAVMTFGARRGPRPGGPWRVFAITLAYAAVAAVVNLLFGTNFLYLRGKPLEPTLLDRLGPWPVYLATGALLALALFWLVDRPFRRRRRTTPGAA